MNRSFAAMCEIWGVDEALEMCRAHRINISPEEEEEARRMEEKHAKYVCDLFLSCLESVRPEEAECADKA